MTTLGEFVDEVRKRLMAPQGFAESAASYQLRCPSGRCGDGAKFRFSRLNGCGICHNESPPKVGGYRRYSPWEIARLLGIDLNGLSGLPADARPANLPGTGSAMPGDSLRGLRTDTMDGEQVAQRLLEDPWILHRFLCLASASGIAGEGELLQTLLLVVTSRLLGKYRLHASLGEQSAAGKSEVARLVLSTLPTSAVLHMGGGVSRHALQYVGDLSSQVVFIDEADSLGEDLRAFLREAVTTEEVTRLVTQGDSATGFSAKPYKVKTKGMVLIQAGTQVIANVADETRMLLLHPDVSTQQTDRILDKQAEQALSSSPGLTDELEIWRKAQKVLKSCYVTVPYARQLRQFFSSDMLRVRRDFPRILSLLRAHACLYQYQRSCYEANGVLMVVAEIEDYRRVYDFAHLLFAQATKQLTPAQEQLVKAIRGQVALGDNFTTNQAGQWAGKAYTTIRDHLKALESLGMVESATYQGQRLWYFVAEELPGLSLPTPDQVISAFHPQTPQTVPAQSYAKAGRFTDSASVTDPQTPQRPEEDVLEV